MTQTTPRPEITLDQQIALRTAATRLVKDFTGTFNTETIERFLHSSYDQFAGRATVVTFLPLLAERFARQRLDALARVEGLRHDGKPVVLFLCVHNAGRSQMALGFFHRYAGDAAVAWSGGSEPGSEVNPAAIAAMAERGIDISGEFPKPWTDEVVRAADVVITMGCGDACPVFPGKRYAEWVLDDPAGLEVAAVRPVRDEIERRVLGLLDELQVAARPDPDTCLAAFAHGCLFIPGDLDCRDDRIFRTVGAAEEPTAAEDPRVAAAVAEALARDRAVEREKLRAHVDRENRLAARSAQVLSGEHRDREYSGARGDR